MRTKPKIAIIHDYLREYGGAERVVEVLHELFPDAPLYTAFVDAESLGIHWQRFKNWEIKQSPAANIPLIKKIYSPLRLLSSYWFESFDLSAFDVVISSTNMYMAKAVLTGPKVLHLCYCHTPPRSLYGYSTQTDWKKNSIMRVLGELINFRMRQIDYITAQRPDYFIANSKETRARISKYYKRESSIIYPPVEVSFSGKNTRERSFFLYVNRLAFSKNPELVVKVATQHNLPLKIVGKGSMEDRLRTIAGPTVEFLGAVNDEELGKLYSEAIALLYPVKDEDFGIVPVEAMMCGTPVIAHASGGPKETIQDGETGLFFEELTETGLWNAIVSFEEKKWDRDAIKKRAMSFSKDKFKQKILKLIELKMEL